MKVAAVIAEFNPLHWGHVHLINEAKKQGYLVIVFMSGSFTQRGEPVIIDKFTRAKDTILAGADLVLTHPVTSSTSHGEEFSSGAIEFLLKLPNLNSIFCGGEISNLDLLKKAIEIDLHFDKHSNKFNEYMEIGLSYTESLKKTYMSIDPNLENIFQPNMLLAFGYAKSLNRFGKLNMLKIIPRIGRKNDSRFISASEIRSLDSVTDYIKVKHSCFNTIPQYNLSDLMNRLFFLYRFSFLQKPKNLELFDGYEEGLENRIYKSLKDSIDIKDFLDKVSTKRYSKVRIQRLMLHYLLNISSDVVQNAKKSLNSFHVLAFSKVGQKYLKECKKAPISLFTNFKTIYDLSSKEQYFHSFEENSSNLWSILTEKHFGLDYKKY